MATDLELTLNDERRAVVPAAASPIAILEAAIKGGVTPDNISVVKDLIQMCREQRAEDAKAAFARAFFQLRKNMPEIYADKEAQTRDGGVAYRYCSEEEISKKLEPHLMSYGFAMLFGQSSADGRITAQVTLMHEAGHQEVREYTVRAGSTNALKDATAADTGAATSAWRHLMIKMFGLKSRISENQDARNEGEPISFEQQETLREMVRETHADEAAFLKFAGAASYAEIGANRYDSLFAALQRKARK
jgi:hypothetical protein